MELWLQSLPEASVIAPRAPLDICNVETLRARLEALLSDGSSSWVICVLDELCDIDAIGLGVLIRAHHLARRNRRQFCIAGGTWQVRRSLDLAGLRQKLHYYPNAAAARRDAAHLCDRAPLPSTLNRGDTAGVNEAEERQAIRGVSERLQQRYPDIDPQIIDATVQEIYASFTASPIRSFLPMLVERETRDRLRSTRHT